MENESEICFVITLSCTNQLCSKQDFQNRFHKRAAVLFKSDVLVENTCLYVTLQTQHSQTPHTDCLPRYIKWCFLLDIT